MALTLRNGQRRTPLVSEDIQADASVRVDVRVVDASREVDLGGLEGVVCREMDGKEEDTTRVRRVTLRHLISILKKLVFKEHSLVPQRPRQPFPSARLLGR